VFNSTYTYHAEDLLADRSRDEEKETGREEGCNEGEKETAGEGRKGCKEHEERFCEQLAAFSE
jgi:flagellar biosynthesis/type III secretory pathway protein FliH